MKTIVVYYSYTSNTKRLVDQIVDRYHYDCVEIEPVRAYSDDYQKVIDEAEKLVPQDDQPAIKNIDVDFSKYDRVILATPVWWYTVASPVNTFLHQYDLKELVVIPLATNGGWLGHTFKDIGRLTNATIESPLSVKFNGNDLVSEKEFNEWLERLEK